MMEGVDAICRNKKTRHYAHGGLVDVNTARQAHGVANLFTGFQRGMHNAKRERAFDEDRQYLREDREYQKTQRDRQEQAQQMQLEVRKAAGAFAASGGVDVTPLIKLHNLRNPDGKINLAPTPDGSGNFALITQREDGTETSKILKPEEIRPFGMNLTQSLHDPNAYFAKQETLEEKRREFNERMALLREKHRLDRRSGSGSGTVQLLNWIQDSFQVDGNEAWDIYKSTAENPRGMAATTYGKLIAARDKAWDPSDPQRPTDDAIWQTTMDTIKRIQGADFAGPSARRGKDQRPVGPPVETNGMRQPAPDNGLNGPSVGPLSGLQPLEAPIQQPVAQPAAAMPAPKPPVTTATGAIPPEALAHLKANAGKLVRFGNGQTLMDDGKGNLLRMEGGNLVPVQ
ncbi:MAG TPA: hypothetical protein VJ325_05590 [Thiobacillus sp.]|nr:hypothetical protein [Thiobacillus sp.]